MMTKHLGTKDFPYHPTLTNYGKACREARCAIDESLYGMSLALGCGSAEQSGREFGRVPVTPEWLTRTRTFFHVCGYEFTLDESTMNDPAPDDVEGREARLTAFFESIKG
jgi:hypothetical protein